MRNQTRYNYLLNTIYVHFIRVLLSHITNFGVFNSMKDDQAVVLMAHEKLIQAIKHGIARGIKPLTNWGSSNALFRLHMGLM